MSETSCDEVLSQVEHYLHGELDPASSALLVEHLDACSPCLQRAEFQRRLREIVKAKCRRAHTPEDLASRIRATLRSEGRGTAS